ncbi:hypothetical protein EDB84DRAFT_1446807, partial [Lactarius hengduanensis]
PADVTRVFGISDHLHKHYRSNEHQQPPRGIPEVRFRVLIIGRANAGKTSILKRICETTKSPSFTGEGKRLNSTRPWIEASTGSMTNLYFPIIGAMFFHDSRGIESGSAGELDILRKFILSKCGEGRLRDRLHAIWLDSRVFAITTTDGHILRYCVPMDNQRPQLDLKYFKDICPERNVPVIAVFTKYDQFRRNVQIHVEDFGSPNEMHKQSLGCDKLIETTAAALNDDIVGLMLLAVQRGI